MSEVISLLTIIETSVDHIERVHSLTRMLSGPAQDGRNGPPFHLFQAPFTRERFFALESWWSQQDSDACMSAAEFQFVMEELNQLPGKPTQIMVLEQLP
jgi:hypothetical protein